MGKKAEWVQQVLGVSVRDPADAAPKAGVLDPASLKEWLDDMNAQASTLAEPVRSAMLARVGLARRIIATPDAKAATAALTALANVLAGAAAAGRRAEAEAAAAARAKLAKVRKLQMRWRTAETEARDDFEAFIRRLMDDPEVKQDPAYKELTSARSAFADLFPDFDDSFADALDDLQAADADKSRDAARAQALKALDFYTEELASAEGLRDLQDLADETYGGLMFYSGLQVELTALRGEVGKVG